MKDEMFLTLKNRKERMDFIGNSDNWTMFDNNSDLLKLRCLFIGERTFVRMLTYEQEFPWCDKSFTDTKKTHQSGQDWNNLKSDQTMITSNIL